MFIILLILAFFALTFNFLSASPNTESKHKACLKALLTLAAFTVGVTELLSTFNSLTALAIRGSWALLVGILSILLIKQFTPLHLHQLVRQLNKATWRSGRLLWLIVLGWLLPLLFLAIYCPPSNEDSMSYHLVRVQHWIQNQNVYYYPTSFTVQNYYNVLSEYILLHVQLLSGNDYFLNTIQYIAMLGSLLAGLLIMQELGVSAKGQWLCIVLILTVPMGILQSTTTQNDYLAGFFTLSSLYWGIRLLQMDSLDHESIFWMALSIALGGFTKYSFFLIALPFTICFGIYYLRQWGWLAAISLFVSCVLVLMIIYLPFWYRNYQALGSILSPANDSPLFLDNYNNEILGWRVIISNLIKNTTMHLALPFRAYNSGILNSVQSVHHWIGLSESDPRTTMGHYTVNFSIAEDTSGNILHIVLFGLALLFTLTQTTSKIIRLYGLCLLSAWLVYSAGFKWQPFHSRTQLPLFQAMAPFTAYIFNQSSFKRPQAVNALIALLLVCSLPYVYSNPMKNLLPIRTLSKQLIGYTPLAVYETDFLGNQSKQSLQVELTKIGYQANSALVNGYTRANINDGHTNTSVMKQLIQLGYKPIPEPSLWTMTKREKLYFPVSQVESVRWDSMFVIINRGRHHHIGLMFTGPMMVYPLWVKGRQAFGDSLKINYVNYPTLLDLVSPNRLQHPYTCIVTNLPKATQLLPPGSISAEHIVGPYRVIELKSRSLVAYHTL